MVIISSSDTNKYNPNLTQGDYAIILRVLVCLPVLGLDLADLI